MLISNLESGRPDIFLGSGTFKKSGTLLSAKNKVQKNRVTVIQLNNNSLDFLYPVFSKKQGAQFFFQGHKPALVFKTRIEGTD